jgi:hypothetical protein
MTLNVDGHLKKCPGCSAREGHLVCYPANPHYFYQNLSRKDRLSHYCKRCTKYMTSKTKHDRPYRIQALGDTPPWDRTEPLPAGYVQCSEAYCGRVYPLTCAYFRLDSKSPTGFATVCRRCDKVVKTTKQESKLSWLSQAELDEAAILKMRTEMAGMPGWTDDGLPY